MSKPQKILINNYYDDENNQITDREKQWGTFERISKNKFLFSIEVSDAMEMIPWLRSYEGYVVVLNDKIREMLADERLEMIKVYKTEKKYL